MTDLCSIAPTAAEVLDIPVPSGAKATPIAEVLDTIPSVRRLAIVVLDAFGSSLWRRLEAVVPTVNRLAGLHHKEICSVRPCLTFACISSVLTGVSPASHGVTERDHLVRAARSGRLESLFDTAKAAGCRTMLAAHRKGVEGLPLDRIADASIIVEKDADAELYNQIPGMLRKQVPEFVFVHLIDIDEAAHRWGPCSTQVREAAAETDRRLNGLLAAFGEAGHAIMLFADHGIHAVQDGQRLATHDGSVEEDLFIPLFWASHEELRTLC